MTGPGIDAPVTHLAPEGPVPLRRAAVRTLAGVAGLAVVLPLLACSAPTEPAVAPAAEPPASVAPTTPGGAAGAAAGGASLSASAAPTVSTQSARSDGSGARPAAKRAPVERDVERYLAHRKGTVAVRVQDLRTGEAYSHRSGARYDSASIVKVAIMAAVLRRKEQQERALTAGEKRLLGAMIRHSDNEAASSLYRSVGGASAMRTFYRAAGMRHTTPGPGRYWGLTRVTAADEVVLLHHLARSTPLLGGKERAYARSLMASVSRSQDWGVSAGPAGAGARVELKNGWLPRSTHGWRVHSIGHVRGKGRDYLVAVLTHDNATMDRGVDTVEGVSRIVWKDLAPA